MFLATLSHELRTPLSTILMQAQALLRAGRTDRKVEHASAAIERAARLQKRLIDDLLDVSRIVSGKLRLDQHVVDLDAIVEGAVEEARPAAEAKDIALEMAIEPGLTAVYADPARMQQVVSNLITNAVKFTPRGGTVSVALQRSAAAARVIVRDTGMGIRPEFLPLLFSRFSQADSSATRVHGGLGLGLAIVKHLVDLHGGGVGAESDGEGRGATLWVTLPLVETRSPRQAPTPATTSADVAGLEVLVVEDDEGTRECLVEVLSAAGAKVHAASTVAQGIEALSAFQPDVLLSDLAMPGEDGFSLLAQVRLLPPERGGRIPPRRCPRWRASTTGTARSRRASRCTSRSRWTSTRCSRLWRGSPRCGRGRQRDPAESRIRPPIDEPPGTPSAHASHALTHGSRVPREAHREGLHRRSLWETRALHGPACTGSRLRGDWRLPGAQRGEARRVQGAHRCHSGSDER